MRIKEIGEKFDVKNVFDLVDKEIKGKFEINYLTKQQITKYKRHGSKLIENKKYMHAHECIFFFNLGFLSRPFTNCRTAGEGRGYLFNFSLPLPPASQTLRH